MHVFAHVPLLCILRLDELGDRRLQDTANDSVAHLHHDVPLPRVIDTCGHHCLGQSHRLAAHGLEGMLNLPVYPQRGVEYRNERYGVGSSMRAGALCLLEVECTVFSRNTSSREGHFEFFLPKGQAWWVGRLAYIYRDNC